MHDMSNVISRRRNVKIFRLYAFVSHGMYWYLVQKKLTLPNLLKRHETICMIYVRFKN